MTPPDLLLFSDFDGNWIVYEQELNRIFMACIARAGLEYRRVPVSCRRHDEVAGRWASFWHLVSEGRIEDDRTPDLRRCERLQWIPWVISNAGSHRDIDVWENMRKRESNTLLWYREEYLVVLAQRRDYWLLKSAYCTTQRGRIEKQRRDRDLFLSTNNN